MDKKVTPTMAIGQTGLRQTDGIVDEEFLKLIEGEQKLNLYNEIRKNSPPVAAALRVIGMLIKQVSWRVEPADESDEAKEQADDTQNALDDMSHTFNDFISEILSMLWAGFAPFEIVYKLRKGPEQKDPSLRSKYNDGKYGWRKIEIRSQDSIEKWGFDEDNGIQGFYQVDSSQGYGSDGLFIPIKKALLFRVGKEKNNPEGESLLRSVVIPYMYIKRIQSIEAIGIERNLAGMPIMEVPPEILSNDPKFAGARQRLEQFITSVRNDERWGALIPSEIKKDGTPSGYKFRLATPSGGTKVTDTDTVIKRYRTEILMTFMTQFLVMGTEKVGSYSLASSMTGLLGSAIGAVLGEIKDVINQFLIPRRQELNGISSSLNPYIEHGDIEKQDLQSVSGYIQQLAATGMISPNESLERHLLSLGDLPLPPELDTSFDMVDDNTVNSVDNSIGAEQIKIILEINIALKSGTIDRVTAVNMIANHLGIAVDDAGIYIGVEKEPDPTPPKPTAKNPDLEEAPNGGDVADEEDGI